MKYTQDQLKEKILQIMNDEGKGALPEVMDQKQQNRTAGKMVSGKVNEC